MLVWGRSVPCGTITKPKSNADIFYIPQRPYNVMGTLRDQMTYPDTAAAADSEWASSVSFSARSLRCCKLLAFCSLTAVATAVTMEHMQKLLEQVDLTYLLTDQNMTQQINWENQLSLGEKQQLAIARLLHHSPRFAILDECTSAVTAEMERRLYHICQEAKITYITIAHRPALRVWHKRMLAIGDGAMGWKLTDIDQQEHYQKVLAAAKASVLSSETQARLRASLEARNVPYKHLAVEKAMPEKTTWGRVWRLCKIGLPRGYGTEHWLYMVLGLATSLIGQVWARDATATNFGIDTTPQISMRCRVFCPAHSHSEACSHSCSAGRSSGKMFAGLMRQDKLEFRKLALYGAVDDSNSAHCYRAATI